MNKAAIGIVSSGIFPEKIGGAETQTLALAQQLSPRHTVAVFTKRITAQSPAQTGPGFLIVRCPFMERKNFRAVNYCLYLMGTLWNLKKRRKKLDLLLCMMLLPNGLIGILAKRLFGIPCVSWVRGGDWFLLTNRLTRYFAGLVVRSSDMVLVQTETIRKSVLARYPEARVRIVPNGVDLKQQATAGSGLLFVGNLLPRKGVDVLLRAFHQIEGQRLVIVGSGPEEERLKAEAQDLNVSFTGRLNPREVEHEMRSAGLLVLPAVKGEGLPNVLLEAMALGVPVVATRVAGIPDLIEDGVSGLLVDPGDPEQLRNAIRRILSDKTLAKSLSEGGRKKAENHSWDRVIPNLEFVLESVLGPHANSKRPR